MSTPPKPKHYVGHQHIDDCWPLDTIEVGGKCFRLLGDGTWEPITRQDCNDYPRN